MRTYPSRRTVLTLLAGLSLTALAPFAPSSGVVRAADWPQWRGPNFNGSSEAAGLPDAIGKDQNLLWTANLPGPSNGTPVIHGDRVFTTAQDLNSRKLLAFCLDRRDGKVHWQREVGIGFRQKRENITATPSPVTDGKTVWFLFGTGELAAFDYDGKPLWARNLQKEVGTFNIMWIYGSSPLLYKNKLYVQVLHRDSAYDDTTPPGAAEWEGPAPSFLLALDPATGKELWRQVRPDDARGETKESYATPIPHTTAAGRDEIIVAGGDAVTGHDPETGRELWRFTGWNPGKITHWRLVPSVVTGAGVILACAPKGGPVMAIREGGSGNVSQSHAAWTSEQYTSDVAVPLFYQGHFYVLDTKAKSLNRVDPKTGEVSWSTKLGGGAEMRASPTGADGKVYCMNANGDVWVVSAEDGKILSKSSLGGTMWSRGSPALADGMVFIRSGDALYAFGKQ